MYLVKTVEEKTSGKTQYGVWTLYVITLQNSENKTLECSYFHSKKAPVLVAGMVLASCDIIKGKKKDYPEAYTLEKPILGDPDGFDVSTKGGAPVTPTVMPTTASTAGTPVTPAAPVFEDSALLVPNSKASFIVGYVKDIYVAGIAAGTIKTIDANLFANIATDAKELIENLNYSKEDDIKMPNKAASIETPDYPETNENEEAEVAPESLEEPCPFE